MTDASSLHSNASVRLIDTTDLRQKFSLIKTFLPHRPEELRKPRVPGGG
jgi:hypothetical protein